MKCRGTVYISEIRGKVGNVEYQMFGQQIVKRSRCIPTQPESQAQLAQRAKYRKAVQDWQNLTREVRNNWEKKAKTVYGKRKKGVKTKLCGYTLFISSNTKSN